MLLISGSVPGSDVGNHGLWAYQSEVVPTIIGHFILFLKPEYLQDGALLK